MLGPHKDAVYYLPGKDVCICPSIRDASPRSLREAMACKVACIVTDIPGARDLVVDGRTGIIVQAGSPQAIAEGIRVLAADRAKNQNDGRSRLSANQDRVYHGGVCTETERSIRRNNDKMIF